MKAESDISLVSVDSSFLVTKDHLKGSRSPHLLVERRQTPDLCSSLSSPETFEEIQSPLLLSVVSCEKDLSNDEKLLKKPTAISQIQESVNRPSTPPLYLRERWPKIVYSPTPSLQSMESDIKYSSIFNSYPEWLIFGSLYPKEASSEIAELLCRLPRFGMSKTAMKFKEGLVKELEAYMLVKTAYMLGDRALCLFILELHRSGMLESGIISRWLCTLISGSAIDVAVSRYEVLKTVLRHEKGELLVAIMGALVSKKEATYRHKCILFMRHLNDEVDLITSRLGSNSKTSL